jgi:hypothetical protein
LRQVAQEAAAKSVSANTFIVEQITQALGLGPGPDSIIVDFLAGDDPAAKGLILWLVVRLQAQEDWHTEEGGKALVEAFGQYVQAIVGPGPQ